MNAVDVRDLFCLYDAPAGSVVALRGLSLSVPAGERLLVHGPNGSGKTTLLRVLSGEQPPSAGTVTVAGHDLVGASPARSAQLRRSVLGLVDQHVRASLRPELSVLDNVALQLRIAGVPAAAARSRAREALATLALDHLTDRSTPTLSGGERQRVAVAAALAHHPALVLADEPTGDLDREAADRVYDLLAHATRELGATLVLVSHDPRAARVADRVVRIRDGRLSEQWSPDSPELEELVVDDRGWVRLPENARRLAGPTVGVAAEPGAIRLTPTSAHRPIEVPVAEQVDPRPAVSGPVVARLAGVSVAYGDATVLWGFDLTVRRGRLTVVSGRSGSGKSTLLRILVGLAPADAGSVELCGTDLATTDRESRAALRRGDVAVAAQEGSLVESMDVEENLRLARAVRASSGPDRTAVLLTMLDLQAVRSRPVRLLSGGERQRVAVARTLVVEPALAVLDEPTSQLDETHAQAVGRALHRAARDGMAVVAATHDPALLALADDVIDLGAVRPAVAAAELIG